MILRGINIVLPLSSLKRVSPYDGNDYYPIEMWYFPRGWVELDQWQAVAVPSDVA